MPMSTKRRQLHSQTFCALGKFMPMPRNCRSSSNPATWPPLLRSVVFSKQQQFSTASHEVGLRPPQATPVGPRPPQATPGKLDSTARAGKQRHLQLSAAISHHYNASSSTALWLCFCMWTSIFRNLGCARSARHRDCEDVCIPFCRMMCSELNGKNIVGARPVERKGPWRHALCQSQCLETRETESKVSATDIDDAMVLWVFFGWLVVFLWGWGGR